jgi:hypothetical protein
MRNKPSPLRGARAILHITRQIEQELQVFEGINWLACNVCSGPTLTSTSTLRECLFIWEERALRHRVWIGASAVFATSRIVNRYRWVYAF